MTKEEEKSGESAAQDTEKKQRQENTDQETDWEEHAAGQEADEKRTPEADFPVVAIGASAGGLHAIEEFFRNLPESPGMAFIVLQHLDPKRHSIMPSLLRDYTSLTIVEIQHGMALAPDHVYIPPPDRRLSLREGKLELSELSNAMPRRLIDGFLFDLAEDQGENAVCIILSGAGSDGAQGLRAVNASGGLVVVQDDQQAEYHGMPHAAIETRLVDFILPVEKMGSKLSEYADQSRKTRRELIRTRSDKRMERDMDRILRTVQKSTGHDFSRYKKNSIRRRIERRMALHRLERMDEYAEFLQRDEGESHALFNDLLINVTSFFRDPKAFAALEKEIFARLREHPQEEPVRVWIPGCATGEEAYSLAILYVEIMERLDRHFSVKIFATDINLQGIQTGREGAYPESIAGELSKQRLERFFTKSGNLYRVSGQIREMVIFSPHNVAHDPPFSNIDLVSCRNLLIYMDKQLQNRVIPLLHYSLKKEALLFLGTSEDVGDFTDLFTAIDRKSKIFRARRASSERHHQVFGLLGRTGEQARRESRRGEFAPRGREDRESPSARRKESLQELVEKTIAEEYAPPGVLVDGNNRILYFHGDASRYLKPPRGEAVFDLTRMAHTGLRGELETLMDQARKSAGRTAHKGARIQIGHQIVPVDLAARKIPPHDSGENRYLITFHEQEVETPEESAKEPDARAAALQRELDATLQDLQATVEMLETTNEELQSTNEELQSNNEELQSTNEELETSREELQSTNEELETVNSELQRKNEELTQSQDDMNNLLVASDICTVILDEDLRIKRFTPAATRIFRLIESDVGRPITDITSILLHDDLPGELKAVIETLDRRNREVQTRDGQWFEIRILPYRTNRNIIAGAVLTLVDITGAKEMEIEAREGRVLAESILETLREPLLVLEENLRVLTANRAFCDYFRVDREQTRKVPLYQLGEQQWDIPDLRRLLERIVPEEEEIRDYSVEGDFPTIGHRSMLLNARRIVRGDDRPELILLSFEDVTEGKN